MKRFLSLFVICILFLTIPTSSVSALEPAPSITYSSEPVSDHVTVTLEPAGDAALGEGDAILFAIGSEGWARYTSPLQITENVQISAKIVRASGSESETATATIECIDHDAPEPPTIIADTTTWVKDSVTVSLVSGSDVGSGIMRSEYRIGESGEWIEYTGEIAVTSATTIFARSVDHAGNLSQEVSRAIANFDTTAPDTSALSVSFFCATEAAYTDSGSFGRYYRDDVIIAVDGAKDTESGVGSYLYQLVSNDEALDGESWKKYSADNKPVISGDFCGYVYVCAVDMVGNVSLPVSSDGIVIDRTAPIIGEASFSTSELTDRRITVTLSVSDNVWLESVTVNGAYIGTYNPQFTAFRNGDYAVVATDKAGNTSKKTVTVSNINATPFNLLSMYASLSEKDFTPSTWAVAKAAASELQGLLTLGSADTLVDAAAEKLAASLEALVHRGDGTLTLELVERVLQNDPEQYTASSWERVLLCIDAIDEVLDDPECTQADIDAARHALEQAVSELRVRGDFTSLDRLIKQCDRVNAADYDADIFLAFEEILEQAKDMSRIDSTQDDVNTMYRTLLDSYGALSKKEEKKGFSPTTLSFVVVGLLIIAAGTALFIVNKRSKQSAARDEAQDAYDDADEYTDDFGSHADTLAGSFGDFHFIDDEESDV